MNRNMARLIITTAGLLWGLGFIGNKFILDNGWSDSQLLFVRFLTATIVIFSIFGKFREISKKSENFEKFRKISKNFEKIGKSENPKFRIFLIFSDFQIWGIWGIWWVSPYLDPDLGSGLVGQSGSGSGTRFGSRPKNGGDPHFWGQTQIWSSGPKSGFCLLATIGFLLWPGFRSYTWGIGSEVRFLKNFAKF